MKHKHSLIAGAVLAACSMSSFAQEAVVAANCNIVAADLAFTEGDAVSTAAAAAKAELLVRHCAPAVTLFVGGASTMKSNVAGFFPTLFDTSATGFTPIQIKDASTSPTAASNNTLAYVGRAKSTAEDSIAGKLIYVVYNYNNGSAGGVSQLLGKVPKIADIAVAEKKIPEAFVPFIGPAKDINTAAPTGKLATPNCGTANTTVTSTPKLVGCKQFSGQTADMALSDTRAEELYAVYPAAAKGKPSTLTQTALFTQSFGVAVSPLLYQALKVKNGLSSACQTEVAGSGATGACQPSITSAEYASLVAKGGKIDSLADLLGTTQTDALVLARRDDLSGTQAVSNIFFVNGQCGGSERFDLLATGDKKGVDTKILKAGGLLGGLPIRAIADSETGVLEVQGQATSDGVKAAFTTTNYAIGVLGTGSGGSQGVGQFVKVDGFSPNFDGGTNFRSATATRAQLNAGYPFAYTLYGMYVTKTLESTKAPYPAKKSLVLSLMESFKNSSLSDISGIAYLDSASASAVAAQQAKFARAKGNNCSPLVKL